jgi:hypothetical protein
LPSIPRLLRNPKPVVELAKQSRLQIICGPGIQPFQVTAAVSIRV